jgi:hypothetical protein
MTYSLVEDFDVVKELFRMGLVCMPVGVTAK